jgi:hypothetical protein
MITSSYLNPRNDLILAERGGVPVIVDGGYRRCTAFLLADMKNAETEHYERDIVGTVFFLSVPHDFSAREDHGFTVYAVTAIHNIKNCAEDKRIYIRVNKTDGGYKDIETKESDWIPSVETDIAIRIMPAGELEGTDADWLQYDFIAPYDTGAYTSLYEGDEIFSIGLFAGFYGTQRIQPIVRFGKIALQPYEQVAAQLDPTSDALTPIDAYLVEVTAWGGQSGSPVFAYFPPGRVQGMSASEYERFERRLPCLMGIIQGGYPYEIKAQSADDVKLKLNAGIAIVIPAQKIIDTLMRKEFVEDRERALANRPKPKIRPVALSRK